jgi:hypothetical protein
MRWSALCCLVSLVAACAPARPVRIVLPSVDAVQPALTPPQAPAAASEEESPGNAMPCTLGVPWEEERPSAPCWM